MKFVIIDSIKKIEKGDTLICIHLSKKLKKELVSIKNLDLDIMIVDGFKYKQSNVLLTEKKYIISTKTQFAINVNVSPKNYE